MYENCRQNYEPRNAFGFGTPLPGAAEMERLEAVRALLANGADPAVMYPSGDTALDRAERDNRAARIECLCKLS